MTKKEAHVINRLTAIENTLRMHPGVREAVVAHNGPDHLIAFVVPDDAFMDEVLGRRTTGAIAVSKWRKALDLSQLVKEATLTPSGFNTIGWNSSYTRKPIPAEQMREWVETTVADILQLAPKDVYEIGCGTGMLLMRIAPRCDRYFAVDISPVVLGKVREQLQAAPSVAKRVEIAERNADNFDGIEEDSFDTIVLNSIVQYFPNAFYLTGVLEKAIRTAKPGGHVYVGDVRSLPLLPAFAASVELFQADDAVSLEDLRARVRRRIEREPEQVISPAYFLSLQHRTSKLSRVEIRPRCGRADNEMTRYRYNAVLHVGDEAEASWGGDFCDWEEQRLTLDDIRSILRRHPSKPLGVMRIRNPRVEKDLAALEAVEVANATYTAGELRCGLNQSCVQGVHPQALIDLESDGLGFAVFLSWAASRPDGSFDAYFIPKALLQGVMMPVIDWPKPESTALVRLTNEPGQQTLRKELLSQLLTHCSQNVPKEMASCEIALVDAIARTSDGEVDALALLASIQSAAF